MYVVIIFSVEQLFVIVAGAFTFDKQKQGRVKLSDSIFLATVCQVLIY